MSTSELENLRAQLERRTAELEQSRSELQSFARVASHDLREPVRKIASFCELLRETQADRLDDEGRQFLEYVVDGAVRMKKMISDLLAFSRLGSGDRPRQRISLDAALDTALEALAEEVENVQPTITADDLPEVEANLDEMALLLRHLIGNALKFRTDGDAEIRVEAQGSDDLWTISVSDNGIGIDKTELENVFDVFHRLHARDDYPGTGIGLAMCQKIIQQHGGSIWAESELGKGSTFRFTLPR